MQHNQSYKNILFPALAVILASCGQNSGKPAVLQPRHTDTVNNTAVVDTVRKEDQQEVKAKIKAEANRISVLTTDIDKKKAELDAATAKKKKIEKFHIGRGKKKKEHEVEDQDSDLQTLQGEINSLEKKRTDAKRKSEHLKEQLTNAQ